VYRTVAGDMADVVAGGPVPLIQPPQGGKVLLTGVRAHNMNGCGLIITASLRDPCTNRIIALEQRPVTLTPDGAGALIPKDPTLLNNFSNIPACPSVGAERDIEAEPYLLRITAEDAGGRTATTALEIVPTCAEPDFEEQCKCECDGNYILGQVCTPEVDGGSPPGTCPTDAGIADAAPTDAGVPDSNPQ
jgi:hypothetical protein